VTDDGRARLADKYRRMAQLRASLPADRPPDAAGRATLKQLAREFPGALRELDSLPTDEIDARLQALERGDDAPWMRWMARYHALMRAALHIKGRTRGDDDLARLAAEAGVDEPFARAVAAPIHGRIMAVVFDRLAAEEGLPRQALWDALFPPRKGPRDYRQG
jgi:hypothetical protein